ncbi:MAG: IclR family transcriptional regulator [Paracoccus sp. (in: a-proteobacteria)]|nr:IclR family transcriptional regulator [Paracoccus sp. (in: a-proteobacteria)]
MNDKEPPRRRGRPRKDSVSDGSALQALGRGIEVLAALADEGRGITLTRLAARLDQPTSSLHRVLVTLEGRGLAEMDPMTQHWSVGAEAFRIGSAFVRRNALVERARPILQALVDETGETANLGVARTGSVLFLAQAETPEMIRACIPPGTLAPMHASGIGKALLAHQTVDELRGHLGAGLARFTPQTLTALPDLMAALEQVRARGFALDDEERTPGMRCIAAPVFDLTGRAVAGMSVSGPLTRMGNGRITALADCVMQGAADLSRHLGAAGR